MQKLKTDKTNNNNNSISLSYPIKNKNTEAEFSTVTEKPFLESMVSPQSSDKSHLLEFNSPKRQNFQEISMVSKYLSAA